MKTTLTLGLALSLFCESAVSNDTGKETETCRFSVCEIPSTGDRTEIHQKSVQLFWFDQSDSLITFTIFSNRLASYLENLPRSRKFVDLRFETDDKGGARILKIDELDWDDLEQDSDLFFVHSIRNLTGANTGRLATASPSPAP